MWKFLLFIVVILPSWSARAGVVPQAPPSYWVEHWFEHNQNLSLVFTDQDVAIYFDKDVARTVTWPNKYLGDVWRYVKRVYGNFGPESELYAIFHTGKYGGGHPSTYFDAHHDYRNVIDCGHPSSDAWESGQGWELDIVTHEVSHIVEIGSKGVHGSPAFPVWGDSKWAEIFGFDVYVNLGFAKDAERIYNDMTKNHDDFPRPNTFWFRDWFYPIYINYGMTEVLNNFFVVLANNYARRGDEYVGSLNMGEFVHFWSGAAGKNLKTLAENAFGWSDEYQTQFQDAQSEYPGVTYS